MKRYRPCSKISSLASKSSIEDDFPKFTTVGANVVVADGSTTLSIGGAALTSIGTVISMGSGGLVVGTSTTTTMPAGCGMTTRTGLGSVLMSGIGLGGSTRSEREVPWPN